MPGFTDFVRKNALASVSNTAKAASYTQQMRSLAPKPAPPVRGGALNQVAGQGHAAVQDTRLLARELLLGELAGHYPQMPREEMRSWSDERIIQYADLADQQSLPSTGAATEDVVPQGSFSPAGTQEMTKHQNTTPYIIGQGIQPTPKQTAQGPAQMAQTQTAGTLQEAPPKAAPPNVKMTVQQRVATEEAANTAFPNMRADQIRALSNGELINLLKLSPKTPHAAYGPKPVGNSNVNADQYAYPIQGDGTGGSLGEIPNSVTRAPEMEGPQMDPAMLDALNAAIEQKSVIQRQLNSGSLYGQDYVRAQNALQNQDAEIKRIAEIAGREMPRDGVQNPIMESIDNAVTDPSGSMLQPPPGVDPILNQDQADQGWADFPNYDPSQLANNNPIGPNGMRPVTKEEGDLLIQILNEKPMDEKTSRELEQINSQILRLQDTYDSVTQGDEVSVARASRIAAQIKDLEARRDEILVGQEADVPTRDLTDPRQAGVTVMTGAETLGQIMDAPRVAAAGHLGEWAHQVASGDDMSLTDYLTSVGAMTVGAVQLSVLGLLGQNPDEADTFYAWATDPNNAALIDQIYNEGYGEIRLDTDGDGKFDAVMPAYTGGSAVWEYWVGQQTPGTRAIVDIAVDPTVWGTLFTGGLAKVGGKLVQAGETEMIARGAGEGLAGAAARILGPEASIAIGSGAQAPHAVITAPDRLIEGIGGWFKGKPQDSALGLTDESMLAAQNEAIADNAAEAARLAGLSPTGGGATPGTPPPTPGTGGTTPTPPGGVPPYRGPRGGANRTPVGVGPPPTIGGANPTGTTVGGPTPRTNAAGRGIAGAESTSGVGSTGTDDAIVMSTPAESDATGTGTAPQMNYEPWTPEESATKPAAPESAAPVTDTTTNVSEAAVSSPAAPSTYEPGRVYTKEEKTELIRSGQADLLNQFSESNTMSDRLYTGARSLGDEALVTNLDTIARQTQDALGTITRSPGGWFRSNAEEALIANEGVINQSKVYSQATGELPSTDGMVVATMKPGVNNDANIPGLVQRIIFGDGQEAGRATRALQAGWGPQTGETKWTKIAGADFAPSSTKYPGKQDQAFVSNTLAQAQRLRDEWNAVLEAAGRESNGPIELTPTPKGTAPKRVKTGMESPGATKTAATGTSPRKTKPYTTTKVESLNGYDIHRETWRDGSKDHFYIDYGSGNFDYFDTLEEARATIQTPAQRVVDTPRKPAPAKKPVGGKRPTPEVVESEGGTVAVRDPESGRELDVVPHESGKGFSVIDESGNVLATESTVNRALATAKKLVGDDSLGFTAGGNLNLKIATDLDTRARGFGGQPTPVGISSLQPELQDFVRQGRTDMDWAYWANQEVTVGTGKSAKPMSIYDYIKQENFVKGRPLDEVSDEIGEMMVRDGAMLYERGIPIPNVTLNRPGRKAGMVSKVVSTPGQFARENMMYNSTSGPSGMMRDALGNAFAVGGRDSWWDGARTLAQEIPVMIKGTKAVKNSIEKNGELAERIGLNPFYHADTQSFARAGFTGAEVPLAQQAGKKVLGDKAGRAVGGLFSAKWVRDRRMGLDVASRTLLRASRIGDYLQVARIDYGAGLRRQLVEWGYDPKQVDSLMSSYMKMGDRIDGVTAFNVDDIRELLTKAGVTPGHTEQMTRRWGNTVKTINKKAGKDVADILFSYRQTKVDNALSKVLFFHYWQTRALYNTSRIIARNPALIRMGYEMREYFKSTSDEPWTRPYHKGLFNFMSTHMFDVFTDPATILLPFAEARGLATSMGEKDFFDKTMDLAGVNPFIQAGLAVLNLGGKFETFSAPNLFGTSAPMSAIIASADGFRNYVLPEFFDNDDYMGLSDNFDIFQRTSNWTVEKFNEMARDAGIPGVDVQEFADVGASRTNRVNNIVATNYMEQHGITDEGDLTGEDLQAIADIIASGKTNNPDPLLADALQTETANKGLTRIINSLQPFSVQTSYTPQDIRAWRRSGESGFATTEEQEQGLKDLDNVLTSSDPQFTAAAEAYQEIGTPAQQEIASIYNLIKSGTPEEILAAYGENAALQVGGAAEGNAGKPTWLRLNQLDQLSDQERWDLADQWLAYNGITGEMDAYRAAREDARLATPGLDNWKDWQSNQYDIGEQVGPEKLAQLLSGLSPGYEAFYRDLPDNQKDNLNALLSAEAYQAYSTGETNIYGEDHGTSPEAALAEYTALMLEGKADKPAPKAEKETGTPLTQAGLSADGEAIRWYDDPSADNGRGYYVYNDTGKKVKEDDLGPGQKVMLNGPTKGGGAAGMAAPLVSGTMTTGRGWVPDGNVDYNTDTPEGDLSQKYYEWYLQDQLYQQATAAVEAQYGDSKDAPDVAKPYVPSALKDYFRWADSTAILFGGDTDVSIQAYLKYLEDTNTVPDKWKPGDEEESADE